MFRPSIHEYPSPPQQTLIILFGPLCNLDYRTFEFHPFLQFRFKIKLLPTMPKMSRNDRLPSSVDFIVVGGGQSGLVVASRLSEDPDKTVLVIEAGSNRKGDPRIDIPGMMTSLYDDPDYDWKHMTVPQENINKRSIAWPRGKVLGGTSAMNFSALVYPAKSDFDNWATLVGDKGWNSESMAPYLQKFHRYQKPHAELKKRMMMSWVDEEAQGYEGPLAASFTDGLGPFVSSFPPSVSDPREYCKKSFPVDIFFLERGICEDL